MFTTAARDERMNNFYYDGKNLLPSLRTKANIFSSLLLRRAKLKKKAHDFDISWVWVDLRGKIGTHTFHFSQKCERNVLATKLCNHILLLPSNL